MTNGGGDNHSTTEYVSFDILGRVTRSKQTTDNVVYGDDTHPMTYTYNLSGALIEQQYPSGRVVKNVLDNDGDLATVQSKKNQNSAFWNYANHFTYNAAGAVTSMQLGNGRWESTKFNERLQPTQIALGKTGPVVNGQQVTYSTELLKLEYQYGDLDWDGSVITGSNNGNVAKQTITVAGVGMTPGFTAVQNYDYDSLNRIQIASETLTPTSGAAETWTQDFRYDRYGNRTFNESTTTTLPKECNGNTEVCAAIRPVVNPSANPADNKLNGYTFDSAGNTTRDAENRKFTYDAENKQTKVETVDSRGNPIANVGEYWYDGDGRRVKKRAYANNVLTEETIFVYDAGGKLIGEYSNEVASAQDAKVAYLTNDHLGSPRINTDLDGNVISRHDYHPFGEEVASSKRAAGIGYSTDTVRKQFTGYERDSETDLDFAQARYFRPSSGRFSSPDPFQGSASPQAPESWNRYAYSYNNPLRYTDPTGNVAGDFYDEEGRQIGTDGNPDGKKYFVAGKTDREKLRKAKGPYTSSVTSAVELPGHAARQEIGVSAVNRSNSPTSDDLKGGFHEEGGSVLGGEAIPAERGAVADALTDDVATMDPTATADPNQQAAVSQAVADGSLDTTYHVHPSGQQYTPAPLTATVETKVGTVTGPREFNQGPSPKDRAFASGVNTKLGYHIVVAARDKQVHFYNAGGAFATMPLSSFVKIK
ncbi:MAG: hypothetical protein DMF63_00670 [Acidobacteria bacterium]|nr:MAG: hypothetical protein DMF63_00670 [Acidobacteriota bacterium]